MNLSLQMCCYQHPSGRQKRYRLLYFFFLRKTIFIFYFCIEDDNVFASITVFPPTGIARLNTVRLTEVSQELYGKGGTGVQTGLGAEHHDLDHG